MHLRTKARRFSIFIDVYLHYYEVLEYGLICKNNPKWGLVSLALGLDDHLIHCDSHLLSFRNEPKKMTDLLCVINPHVDCPLA